MWGWGVRMGLGGPFVGLGLRTGVLGTLRGAGHATDPRKPSGPGRRHGRLGISASVTNHTRERAGLGQVSACSEALHGWDLP